MKLLKNRFAQGSIEYALLVGASLLFAAVVAGIVKKYVVG